MQAPKFLIKFTGDLYLHKQPFFAVYKPNHHKVKGSEVRQILNSVEKGDILLRRYNGYLNTILTPGFQGHAALVVDKDNIIHAIGEGVVKEDILDFCRTDSICVLRVKNTTQYDIYDAIDTATKLEQIRTGYDYEFKSNNGTVYCTELVDVCYKNIFTHEYSDILATHVLSPDGIYKSLHAEKIIEFIH